MPLVIPSDVTSHKVYVSLDSCSKAQFSLDNSTWFSGPITWTPASGNTTPLNITFSLGTGITGVTPFLALSGTSATAPSRLGEASFFITKSDNTIEDPKIIITPQ